MDIFITKSTSLLQLYLKFENEMGLELIWKAEDALETGQILQKDHVARP